MEHVHYIDIYCERTAPGFWNEPVNALSNGAFLIAAIFALRLALRREKLDWPEIGIILLAGMIGVGSFLFHTFATYWALLADVIPIWSFVALFTVLVIYRLTGGSGARTVRIVAIALAVTAAMIWLTSGEGRGDVPPEPDMFNGSLQYAPAVVIMTIFGILTMIRGHPARYHIVAATVIFLISLTFRSIDFLVCDATGIGTHFLWHSLNGLMIGVLLHALVVHFPPQRDVR